MKKFLIVTLLSVMGLSFAHASRGGDGGTGGYDGRTASNGGAGGGYETVQEAPISNMQLAKASVYIDQLTRIIYISNDGQQAREATQEEVGQVLASLVPAFCFGAMAQTPYCRSILHTLNHGGYSH